MDGNNFSNSAILSYLGLPQGYTPPPSESPIEFLQRFLYQIPPHLITSFGLITTPKQRSAIPEIRNRRLRYTETVPKELAFESASVRWSQLWPGRQGHRRGAGEEERRWANREFMGGMQQQVGKLGALLSEYEEERQAEGARALGHGRREEEEDGDDMDVATGTDQVYESLEEQKLEFERRIKELFIYGLLEGADYSLSDWSEQYDVEEDRCTEEQWFDDEEDLLNGEV